MANYTAAEMVQAAKDAGHQRVSPRLVTDWEAHGLLDQPKNNGSNGRGGKVLGTWDENQLHLFLSLLEVRVRTKAVADLCSIPVWLWLWWGDDYVPMRQVKKAMTTWATAARKQNHSRAATGTSRLVRTWGRSETPWADSRRLADSLPPMAAKGTIDKSALRPDVARAFGLAEGDANGSSTDGDLSVDGYVGLFRARVEAIARITAPAPTTFKSGKRQPPIADGLLEWARVFYLTTRQGYDRKRPQLAAVFGAARHGDGALEDQAASSCGDLATILGLALTGQVRAAPGSLDDPQRWTTEGMRSHLRTTMTEEGIDVAIDVSPRAAPEE